MPDQKVTFLAEMPGGTFRKETLTVTEDGLENKRKRHLYDNEESCVFPVTRPHPLESFDELLDPPPSEQLPVPEKWAVIGEYDGMFPYSTHVVHDWEQVEHRQERRTMLFQIGLKRASAANARAALENPFANTLIIATAAIAALMVMIVATAMVFKIFGNQPPPVNTSLAIPFMLGAVAMGKRPRRGLWSVYLYDTVEQRKLHYSLPFSEIAANVPQSAWRFPSVVRYKWLGMFCGMAVPIMLAAMGISRLPLFVFFWVTGAMMLILPFAFIGWKLGPWFMKNYVWWCRPYVKLYRGIDSEGEYLLQPIAFTNLTGIDPVIWEGIADERFEVLKEAYEEAGQRPPKINPIINRASDAWNCKYSPLYKEYANHIPWSLAQKLQVGSMAVLILGTIGLSFFIIMALSGG